MGKQYELYVQKGQPFWKVLTNILFSHVGLLVLVIGYCVAGEKPGTHLTIHHAADPSHPTSTYLRHPPRPAAVRRGAGHEGRGTSRGACGPSLA